MYKKISIFILFLLLLFSSREVLAQSGIKGIVKDKGTGETLIGANIRVDSLENVGASAGLDGDYTIPLQPGNYSITCSFVGYVPKTIKVTVVAGKVIEVNFAMDNISIKMDEFVIKDTKIEGGIISTVTDTKNEDQVVSVMGKEEIKKGTYNTSADVARKIPGVTVVDNRFVIVRGLTERYNAVLINNALAPSLETDVKSFSFDILPSGVIEKFMIYKSPSPDLPGEFAGGAIQVFTSSIPQSSGITASYSTSFRTQTTGNSFLLNEGSSKDWMGLGLKDRNLPSGFPENIRTSPSNGEVPSLPNNWGYDITKANLDQRFTLGINQKWELNKNATLATVSSINYSFTNQFFESNRLDYNTYDSINQSSDTIFYYRDSIFQKQVRVGFMHNWAFRYKNHSFDFRNILNQNGTNETNFRQGTNYEEGNDRKEYSFRYNQRTLYTGQLGGKHSWNKHDIETNKVEWTIGYSLARRNDPDWKRIRYARAIETEDPFVAYIPFSAQPFYMGRLFLDMDEDIKMISGSFEHTFLSSDKDSVVREFQPKIKAGFYLENKDRTFSVRNIGYAPSNLFSFNWNMAYLPVDSLFMPENINSTNGLKLDEDTKGSDSYVAANYLRSYYLMGVLPFNKHFNLTGGLRVEDNLQSLYSAEIGSDTVIVENHIISPLPSANFVFKISDTLQFRLAYGKTLNRPEFRELAPLSFYDFVFNSIYTGNDSLLTPTIHNFDFRTEYYPSSSEMISIGVFYKKFINPIEMYFVPGVGSGGTRSFSYQNSPSATSFGVELDIRKSFSKTKIHFIKDLTFVGNFSYIKSKIQLNEDGALTGLDPTRPMMGQSPYIINAGLYYQNDSIGLGVSVMFNRVGERVVIVGIPDIPEVYEMPRSLLDITISQRITKHITIRFSAQDLLNQNFVLLQDANNDKKLDVNVDQRMQFYKRGSYFTLGFQFALDYDKKKKPENTEVAQ